MTRVRGKGPPLGAETAEGAAVNVNGTGTNYDDAPNDTEEEETPVETAPADPEPENEPVRQARRRAPAQVNNRRPVETPVIEGDPTHVPMDVTDRWPAVIDWVQKQYGLGADSVRIKVYGIALGPYAGVGQEDVGEIPGDCVAGDEQRSPGQALRDWVIDAYHMIRKGPTKYKFRFMHRMKPQGVSDYNICGGELVLGSPEVIAHQRRAEAEAYNRAHRAGSVVMPPAAMPHPHQGAAPPQQLPPGSPQPLMLPPAPAGTTWTDDMVRDMFQRFLSGQPIGLGTAPAPAAPPPLTFDQELERILKVAKALGLGAQPAAAPAPPQPTFDQELERIMKVAKAMGLSAPQPVQQAIVHAPAAAAKATTPLDTIKETIGFLKQVDEVKEALGMGGGDDDKPEPPDEDPPFKIFDVPGSSIRWPHGDNLSTMEQAKQFLALNPDASFKMLEGLAQIIDRTTIGRVLQQMMQRGNPTQQAAAKAAVQAGLAAVPPPTNGALPAPHPTVPSPPPAPPESGWIPPV